MRVVKGKARPMAVGGTLISGALMAGLAAAYVQAVNEGEPVLGRCPASSSKQMSQEQFDMLQEHPRPLLPTQQAGQHAAQHVSLEEIK